jgi:orotidine-5'-phosphate decarboxylase
MAELILALDVEDRAAALRIAKAVAPHVDAFKVGYPLALSAGLSIARELKALPGKRLIADFKVADIPETSRLICEQVFTAGFDAVIAQGFVGMDAVKACVQTAHARGGECYVVAEMSHPGAVEFFHQGVAERIAAMAVIAGADGIIAPATRPDRIRTLRQMVGRLKIYSPGVGAQGGELGQVTDLVDGVIIGRMIYGAADPAAVARGIRGRCR